MNETDRGRLSARVRVIEALEHLQQARGALAEDDELAAALDDAVRRVERVSDGLVPEDRRPSADATARAGRRRN